MRRVLGFLVLGGAVAVGYVLFNGADDDYRFGGLDDFSLSGWELILGVVGLVTGTGLIVGGSENLSRGYIAVGYLILGGVAWIIGRALLAS